jgi:hypothetical protein
MSTLRQFLLTLAVLSLVHPSVYAFGPMLKTDPVVPAGMDFVRSLDLDTFVESTNQKGLGAQSERIRVRFLDPDVDAFVGMVVGVHHFNQDLRLGDPQGPDTAGVMCNWGGAFGIVRGKHLWELDLMGSSLSDRLGFAPAIVGEHHLSSQLLFYHRTELNIFVGDAILDAEQGLDWMCTSWAGVSLGYRWFTSDHMDRSGPYIGLRFYFESPKIPFIFPSLG